MIWRILFDMDSIVYKWEKEIRNRCKKQNLNIENCIIMFSINDTYFNGERISGYSESKDGRWICIPILNERESDFYGEYVYSPQCFEIRQEMTTYLSNGSMWSLATIWLLECP